MSENRPSEPQHREASDPKSGPDPSFRSPKNFPSLALSGLFILAVFYTFFFARLVLLPLVLALLFSLLLSPLVRGLRRFRIPEGLGAGMVVLLVVGLVAGSGYLLLDPATEWINRAPSSLEQIKAKLRTFKKPVEKVHKATEEVEKLTQMGSGERKPPPVQVQQENLSEALLGRARTLAAESVVMLVLLYFLLASGDLFLRKLIRVLTTLEDKKRAVEIARRLQEDISIYLLTITLINLGLGVAEGIAMYLLGMPNPLLWGMLAAVLNYIPYLGAMVGMAVIAAVAALTFDMPGQILLPPLVYFLLTAAEGYLITPHIIGRRLTLNPVMILLGLIFWGWMWGIVGAIVAVPLLVSFKILCDHIPRWEPMGEFLAR